jgi:hypothetical protein
MKNNLAEDGISPKPVQRSTKQARIDGRTSVVVSHYLAAIIIFMSALVELRLLFTFFGKLKS